MRGKEGSAAIVEERSALLMSGMNDPYPNPFCLGRKTLKALFSRPLGEGESEGIAGLQPQMQQR